MIAHIFLNVPEGIVFNTDRSITFNSLESVFYVRDEICQDLNFVFIWKFMSHVYQRYLSLVRCIYVPGYEDV